MEGLLTVSKVNFDIDIDLANRDQALNLLEHVPASINRSGEIVKHNTGVYVTDIPANPLTGWSSIYYDEADHLGYVKLDLLNVAVYEQVRDEEHLLELMNREPNWERLSDKEFVEQIIHINAHFNLIHRMPEVINSIPRMAMFLGIIRPAKRHLVGQPWKEVAKEVWTKPTDGEYYFKKAHGVAYAHLVVVHMNLLEENG